MLMHPSACPLACIRDFRAGGRISQFGNGPQNSEVHDVYHSLFFKHFEEGQGVRRWVRVSKL